MQIMMDFFDLRAALKIQKLISNVQKRFRSNHRPKLDRNLKTKIMHYATCVHTHPLSFFLFHTHTWHKHTCTCTHEHTEFGHQSLVSMSVWTHEYSMLVETLAFTRIRTSVHYYVWVQIHCGTLDWAVWLVCVPSIFERMCTDAHKHGYKEMRVYAFKYTSAQYMSTHCCVCFALCTQVARIKHVHMCNTIFVVFISIECAWVLHENSRNVYWYARVKYIHMYVHIWQNTTLKMRPVLPVHM